MTNEVYFDTKRQLGIITLARQSALNALNLEMIKAIQQQLLTWEQDDAIYAVVIQAESGKAFCAGGDVRWLYDTGLTNRGEQMQFFWHEYRLNYFISQFKKPYIALLNGITMGGGVGISLHGAYAIANEQFMFAMPETSIGLFPDVGASYLLARCPGQIGLYLALTGNRLNAKEALAAKLIQYQVSNERFEQLLSELSELDLRQHAHAKLQAYLETLHSASSQVFPQLDKINQYFSQINVSAIVSDLEKSSDAWATQLAQSLKQKSPLSLAVTFEQMQRAKTQSLAECLTMDYGLVAHFMADHDFYEGVRALLIDKDKNPQWLPATLNEITPALVAGYFKKAQNLSFIS